MKLYVEITFPLSDDAPTIKSNVKESQQKDVLESFIQSQVAEGRDKEDGETIERDTYKVRVDLDLRDDSFTFTHDCGNNGLATGIVLAVLREL